MKKISIKLQVAFITIILIISYYVLYWQANNMIDASLDKWIYLLSLFGVIELGYIIFSWRKLTREYVTLYTLFIIFFFLFNYGQPLLWAFGIYKKGHLGTENLYYSLQVPRSIDIFRTQLIVLISGWMIHFGAILFKKVSNKRNGKNVYINKEQEKLYKFSKFIAPGVLLSQYYVLLSNLSNARIYGYTALYYNPEVESANVIFSILSRLFLPVLLGLLLGSNYSKKVQKKVYILFLIKVILSLMVGDRGGWIFSVFILIVSHNLFNKKIRMVKVFWLGLPVVLLSYVSEAVMRVRNSGVTLENIFKALTNLDDNAIVSTISLLGKSMGVTLTLVMNGWDIFPYGNTFLYGLIVSPTPRLIGLLNLNYETLSSWFSQSYLGLTNGAGFSIVAEILLNYGPYLLPLFMFIFGIFIYWITDIESKNINTDLLYIMFCLITTSVMISISRGYFGYNMGEFLKTTVQYFFYYYIYDFMFYKYKKSF